MNKMKFNNCKFKKIIFRIKMLNKNSRVKSKAKVAAGRRLIHLIKKFKIMKKFKNRLQKTLNNKIIKIKMI